MNYLKALKIRIAASITALTIIAIVMFIYNKDITISVGPMILEIALFVAYLIYSTWMDIKFDDLNSIWRIPGWQVLVNIAITIYLLFSSWFEDKEANGTFLPVIPLYFTVNLLIDDMRRYKLYVKYGLDENQDAYYLGKTHPEVIHNMSKKYRDYFTDVGEIEKKDNIIE